MVNRKESGETEQEVLTTESNLIRNEKWDEQKAETEYDIMGTALNEL
ncbi:hypothetical protein ACQYAD_11195 [Neobacillus sp. SM06]